MLTSCANQGVIVRKDSGPLPFYETLGVDGSYSFFLLDSAGSMRRQLVTPEVFERYAVGQYFNDLQPVTAQTSQIAQASAFQDVRMARVPVAQKTRRLATAPVVHKARRTVNASKATHSRRTAAKTSQSRKAIAKRTPAQRKKKAVRAAQTQPAKATPSWQMLSMTVARCR